MSQNKVYSFPIITAGDADYTLTTTDMTTAGSTTTITNATMFSGTPGKLELSKDSTGSATVKLSYWRENGEYVEDESHTFTAGSGTYSDNACAKLYKVEWSALAENLTIGQITKLWFHLPGYMGDSDGVIDCKCHVSGTSIATIGTKGTNWDYDIQSKCAWILVSAITGSATDVQFTVNQQ